MSKSSKPTPIALPNDLVKQIQAVCLLTGESQQTIMRLAMRIGLSDLAAIKHDAAKVIREAAADKGQSFVNWAAQKADSPPDLPTTIATLEAQVAHDLVKHRPKTPRK